MYKAEPTDFRDKFIKGRVHEAFYNQIMQSCLHTRFPIDRYYFKVLCYPLCSNKR